MRHAWSYGFCMHQSFTLYSVETSYIEYYKVAHYLLLMLVLQDHLRKKNICLHVLTVFYLIQPSVEQSILFKFRKTKLCTTKLCSKYLKLKLKQSSLDQHFGLSSIEIELILIGMSATLLQTLSLWKNSLYAESYFCWRLWVVHKALVLLYCITNSLTPSPMRWIILDLTAN